jgi:transglutaminase-like putative cysteine protease
VLISIDHVTRYSFAEPAHYSVQCLRLTPPSFEGQRVVYWKVEMPNIDGAVCFRDSFGNTAHLISLTEACGEISIIAKGTVETEDKSGFARGLTEVSPARVYKRETPKTAANDAIRDLSASARATDPIDRMHELMDVVRDNVDYAVGVTNAHTSAAEALSDGRGVCQDHAQIFISAARVMGVPARYVNGYFLTETDEPSEAHHAWAEAHIAGLGWLGFDPANRICPTDHYVRLSCGLDAGSAAPIRGTRRGGSDEMLDVLVEVQQQSAQQ